MIIKAWKTMLTWKDYTISVLYDTGTIRRYHSDNTGEIVLPDSVIRFIKRCYSYTAQPGETMYKQNHD
jgi:hypothetical protein